MSGATDKWLVRTEQNVISGPFSKEKVCQMIASGQLGYQDEVCDAHSYWIYLHETREIKRQLGIVVPRQAQSGDEEEVTETDIVTGGRSHEGADSGQDADENTDFPEFSDALTENTAVLSNRAFRQFQTKKPQQAAAAMRAASTAPAGIAPPNVVESLSQPASSMPRSIDQMVTGESLEESDSESVAPRRGLLIALLLVAIVVGIAILFFRMRVVAMSGPPV